MMRVRASIGGIALTALAALAACSDLPAVLDPHGSNAQQTARIAWVLFWGGGVIFVAVMALAAFAVFAPKPRRAWLGRPSFVVGAGIVFPFVTLSALLVYALVVSAGMISAKGAPPLKIEIIGEMWWWRVRYVDAGGASVLVTPNEVHIPVGRSV